MRVVGRTSRRLASAWLGCGASFALAMGLRLWGIDFGLPDLYHPDEPAYVLQALAVGRGLPDGLTFANPPLLKYLLLGEYAADYALMRALGATRSAQQFVEQFRADPSQLYLIARCTSALFGALTVVAAFALGSAVRSRRAGLIAAFLTAVTYLLARESHFGVNDALVTLLVTLGLVFCVRIARGGRRADYLIAGALAGLAFAAKYYGIALLAPLVLAHLVSPASRRALRDLALAFGVCVAAAGAGFPSLVTETGRVVHDIYVHLIVAALGGYDGLDPSGGYVFYARTLGIGLGWLLVAAAAAGLALSVARRDRPSLVIASLPLAMLAGLGAKQLYFARFLLPTLPALIVEAALPLDVVAASWPAAGLAATLLVATPTLVDSIRLDTVLARADTRTLARDWIERSLPAGSVVAVDAPPLGPALGDDGQHRMLVANGWSLFDLTRDDYRAHGVDYLVVSSFTSEARAMDPRREARRAAFFAALPREASTVAEFRPYSAERPPPFAYDQIYAPFDALEQLDRPGPTITIYRLSDVNGRASRSP